MSVTRRQFVHGGIAALLASRFVSAADATPPKIRVSAREASYGGKLEAAARCDLDGVELGCGPAAERLKFSDPALRQQYKDQCKSLGLVVSSLSMDLLNDNPLATDPNGASWLEQTIAAAKDFDAAAILVPFFGKANLLESNQDKPVLKARDIDVVVARMKEAAPAAKAANVMLGLENRLSAEQNLRILDRIGSDSVKVWYDIGHSFNNGYDVPAEIRSLKDRIAVFHFKDNPHYLGEGKIDLRPIAESVHAIDYAGWIVLETVCPSHDCEADCKKNVATVRKLLGLRHA